MKVSCKLTLPLSFDVNIHWISFLDGKMHSAGIEFADFPTAHSAENISDEVINTIDEYELQGRIIGIVIDNAKANDNAMDVIALYLGLNKKTFPTPQELHIRCFGHALNLTKNMLINFIIMKVLSHLCFI